VVFCSIRWPWGADAAHLLSDVVALSIAVGAQYLASRPASRRHSFGWRRAEVMARN